MHGVLAGTNLDVDEGVENEAGSLSDALRVSLAELGESGLRVNNDAVRRAVRQTLHVTSKDEARSAMLMRCLLEVGGVWAPGTDAPAVAAVAVFAALLADLQDGGGPGKIEASAAIAHALAVEISAAGSDETALARLFAEFRGHV